MNLLIIILIAVSLSMDAFSLALSYGTMAFPLKSCLILSLSVGVFHFFMPMIGAFLGAPFVQHFHINIHFMAGIIFTYIALQMFKEFKSEENCHFDMTLFNVLVFALGVSLDSFGVGFALNKPLYMMVISSGIFALFSFSFTFLGLTLGKVLNKLIGSYAIIFGASIMCLLAIINFVNFCSFN